MRLVFPLIVGLLLAAPALAAEDAPGKTESVGGAPGTNVDMPIVIAPILVDGKLTGYAYVQSRLTAATPTDALAVRDKIAFVLDAFVRDVNARPVTLPDNPGEVDQPGIAARMLADARRIMGASHVKSIAVTAVQIAPLHPSTTAAPAALAAPETIPAAPAKPVEAH